MSNIQFQGIVAVGNTQGQAVNRYRMMAMGKGAACFVDEANKQAFISNAAADLDNTFNPANGNMDLVQSSDALKGLQFEAKAGDVHEAFHHQCTAGCGVHIVYDSQDYVKNCPVCATSLSASDDDADEGSADDLSDDELDDLEVDDGDDEDSDDSDDEDSDDEDEDDSEDDSDDSDSDSDDDSADDEDASDDADDDSDDSDADTGTTKTTTVKTVKKTTTEDAGAGDDADDSDADSDDDSSDDSDDDTDADDSDDDSEDDEDSDDEDTDDSDDDSDDEDSDDEDDSDDSDEDDDTSSDDEPLVIAADTKEEAVAKYSHLRSQNMKAQAGAKIVSVDYKVCAGDNGCGAHLVSEVELDKCPRTGCGNLLQEPTAMASDTTEDKKDDENKDDASLTINGDKDKKDDENKDDADKDKTAEASDDTDPDADDADADDADEDSEDDDSSDDEDTDDVSVDALDDVPDDADVSDMDVSYSAAVAGKPVWTAYYKGTPVAMASAETIQKDHLDIFGTPRFGQATAAAAKIGGVKKILKELGYKGVASTLKVGKHINAKIAALATEHLEELEKNNETHAERLQQALATAAVGITRGHFMGESNPVREALCSALASCGVRSPEVVVDNALRTSFEPFLRQMFAKASDILEKPVEVQDGLAQTVLESGYMPQSATASSSTQLERRLSNFGTVTASSDKADDAESETETAVASAGSDDFSARLAATMNGLGRR